MEGRSDWLSIWISIAALFFSLFSLYISFENNETARKSYQLNLKPIITVDFNIDNNQRKYILKILNDGPNTIYEVRIRMLSRAYNKTKNLIDTATGASKDWNYIKELKPQEKKEFIINYADLKNTYNLATVRPEKNNDVIIPIQLFYIFYRRKPDHAIFHTKKYLYILQEAKSKSPWIKVLKPNLPIHLEIMKSLETYDKERL